MDLDDCREDRAEFMAICRTLRNDFNGELAEQAWYYCRAKIRSTNAGIYDFMRGVAGFRQKGSGVAAYEEAYQSKRQSGPRNLHR